MRALAKRWWHATQRESRAVEGNSPARHFLHCSSDGVTMPVQGQRVSVPVQAIRRMRTHGAATSVNSAPGVRQSSRPRESNMPCHCRPSHAVVGRDSRVVQTFWVTETFWRIGAITKDPVLGKWSRRWVHARRLGQIQWTAVDGLRRSFGRPRLAAGCSPALRR